MDSLFPTVGNYKLNIQINDIPLDECSFVRSSDTIRPYFEGSVSNDPDVTSLMVFLRDFRGDIAGLRIIYELIQDDGNDDSLSDADTEVYSDADLEDEEDIPDTELSAESDDNTTLSGETVFVLPQHYRNGDELVIPVKSLDNLPLFPFPADLPMGRYTMVFQIMNDKDVLQRVERSFFFLGRTNFSYNGINVHLPGIADNTQLIPKGTLIMLEADLTFDNNLDPYIEWYNGRRKISEGKYSDGAGYIFWKAPEESGFFSMRAVVYPIENFDGMSGYQKDISLLVSSKFIDIHLVTEDSPNLLHWYTFEGNLNDLKASLPADQAVFDKSLVLAGNGPDWKASNGTYGLATGYDNIINLPVISNNETKNWQTLFRFKPEHNGGIFSVRYSNDVFMHLYIEGSNLVLSLTSALETVSQVYGFHRVSAGDFNTNVSILPADLSAESDDLWSDYESDDYDIPADGDADNTEQINAWVGSFLTAGIMFSIQDGRLSAQLNILGDSINSTLTGKPITIEADIDNQFQVLLGSMRENVITPGLILTSDETSEAQEFFRHRFITLWDEFAVYSMPEVLLTPSDEQPDTPDRLSPG